LRQSIFLFALLVAGSPALSGGGSENYRAVMEALERCETAWFERSKRAALDEISRLAPRVVLEMNPMSRDFESQSQRAKDVTDALNRCAAIVYGN
jgi:hypothetical protein